MSKTHNMTGTRLYRIWKSMRSRCNNHHTKQYKDYGGRGITICEEWDLFENFYQWSMQNGYEESLTIDRINNNGNYSPDNCRWITTLEQNQNRRNSITVFFDGKPYTPTELSKITGISVNTIYDAHRSQGINDFTNYKPKKSQYKNITKRKTGYELVLKGKYIGHFKTLGEAITVRDKILSTNTEI